MAQDSRQVVVSDLDYGAAELHARRLLGHQEAADVLLPVAATHEALLRKNLSNADALEVACGLNRTYATISSHPIETLDGLVEYSVRTDAASGIEAAYLHLQRREGPGPTARVREQVYARREPASMLPLVGCDAQQEDLPVPGGPTSSAAWYIAGSSSLPCRLGS